MYQLLIASVGPVLLISSVLIQSQHLLQELKLKLVFIIYVAFYLKPGGFISKN